MLKLKTILDDGGIAQADLARYCVVSKSAITQLIRHNQWPKTISREEMSAAIFQFLKLRRLPVDGALEIIPDEHHPATPAQEEEDIMFLRRDSIKAPAKKQFGIFTNPFDDVRTTDDVYLSPDIRYVREGLMDAVRNSGFMAVVGESGSGKTTLRCELIERLRDQPVIFIQPNIQGMEENDEKGKSLKTSHIAEAILSAVAPLERPKASMEARLAQVIRKLSDSSRSGYSHVLIIEEAHSLSITMLKHLKRLHEMKDGMRRLLGIVLIGQPELAQKLSAQNPMVREVVQRCEVVTLNPLQEYLKPFLQQRFKSVGLDLANIMDDDAIEAIRTRLSATVTHRDKTTTTYSLLYPLLVQNLVTTAINTAAEYGLPKVTAEIIRKV